jgi:hypothetical protein
LTDSFCYARHRLPAPSSAFLYIHTYLSPRLVRVGLLMGRWRVCVMAAGWQVAPAVTTGKTLGWWVVFGVIDGVACGGVARSGNYVLSLYHAMVHYP